MTVNELNIIVQTVEEYRKHIVVNWQVPTFKNYLLFTVSSKHHAIVTNWNRDIHYVDALNAFMEQLVDKVCDEWEVERREKMEQCEKNSELL